MPNKALIYFLAIFSLISFQGKTDELSIKFSAPASSNTFLLPVPNKKINVNSKLFLTSQIAEFQITPYQLNTWVNTDSKDTYIRLLVIKKNDSSNLHNDENVDYILRWESSKDFISEGTLPKGNIPQLIYPSTTWLAESILLHPSKAIDSAWYTTPQTAFAHFVTNENLLKEKGYPPTRYSQWLFDRPRAIYQLFIQTGNEHWLTSGNVLLDFYIRNLDDSGNFKLIKGLDLKYLMPNGLLYHYYLTGNNDVVDILKSQFKLSLNWNPKYTDKYVFWTEIGRASCRERVCMFV